MKNSKLIVVVALIAIFSSCKKEISSTPEQENVTPRQENESNSAPRLLYSDSLFFIKNVGVANIINPTSIPVGSGIFKAIPSGLKIDSVTGKINIAQSLTGLRYKVYYVQPGTTNPIDSFKLVISGIDYKDSIYELNSTPNVYETAFPIYNANKNLPLPCGGDDDDDSEDDDNCIFDETDLDNDGNDDIPGVNQEKLLVNTKNGRIDVEGSFHAGLFGGSNPPNGTSKDFKFYYRIGDGSNMALNNITVRVMVYKYRWNIPQSIINRMNRVEQLEVYTNQGRLADYLGRPKRPPFIIIVTN